MIYPIKHLTRALLVSVKGLKSAYKHEWAPLGFYLGNTPVEKVLLISSLLLILILELVNSAIEAVVDRISAERHELSARAKDIGSAAVFLSLINAAVIWFFIIF